MRPGQMQNRLPRKSRRLLIRENQKGNIKFNRVESDDFGRLSIKNRFRAINDQQV